MNGWVVEATLIQDISGDVKHFGSDFRDWVDGLIDII